MDKYAELISWVEDIKEWNHSSAAALFILKDNEVVLEHYSGNHSNTIDSSPITASSQFHVASARKSYLGLAIAYALYEGKIKHLDDYAADYFEDYDKDILGKTTIRHLVTHSHGLNTKENGTMYREFEPGQGWAYRGINVLMMTQLINKLYSKNFPELLKERVFTPAGFKETAWRTKEHENLVQVVMNPNEEAVSHVGKLDDGTETNLFVSAREFAYWGNLHLNKGYINGNQIVPKKVIEIATQVQCPHYKNTDLPQNGLFWFVQNTPALQSEIGERVPKGSYQILGVTGPTILVIPEYNVVIAKMYNKRYNYGGNNYLQYLREFSNLVADTFAQ
ncbi:serine hydrolase domain-containing protein [Bacillus sp. DX1.1]|uniref:serine hydrolase domain-containing protein n=1 Tax=unclassified Bacillus (in: firmicutes) TaxID=185979 RepID=UPI002571031F|nr:MULTISPECIES: serine hydrolase domain-containing protein [unclassified Bacillus (in: firmicutes)]MDM5155092.1 serine hydrolase domain-containing protein [Bacillus sp. DX1.1]WJE83949.1 serine hydrolase domain-containing protein [Bacillus sp. DX3.1]